MQPVCKSFFCTFAADYNRRVMKLSELKTGEKGIIVKVLGHGGFRKRIIEMGFIKGQEVEVPLPVYQRLMIMEKAEKQAEDFISHLTREGEA